MFIMFRITLALASFYYAYQVSGLIGGVFAVAVSQLFPFISRLIRKVLSK